MAQSAFFQSWAIHDYWWLSKDPAQVGMQLDGAFRRFAAAVNTNPGNAAYPLQVLRSHADATGTTAYGYVWSLGHPAGALLISCRNTTTAQMTYGTNAYNAQVECGLAAAYNNDPAVNGGYGSFASAVYSFPCFMEYVGMTLTYASSSKVVLLIYQDTTPGREYFGYMIKVRQGDIYTKPYDTGLLIFRDPAGHWNSYWYVPYPDRAGWITGKSEHHRGHSYIGERPYATRLWTGYYATVGQLTNRCALTVDGDALATTFARVNGQFPYQKVVPPVLPAVLYAGVMKPPSGADTPSAYNFCRRIDSGGRFYELGCKNSNYDYNNFNIWLWVPDGLTVDQPAPWEALTAFPQWCAQNKELIVLHPPDFDETLPVVSFESDYLTVVPPIMWMGLGAHGAMGPASGHGGSRGGGSAGGGSSRPTNGLLWPRRN